MKNISSAIINYFNNRIGYIFFSSKQKRIIVYLFFIISYVSLYFLVDYSSQSLVAHDEGLYARRSRLVEESFNWFSPPFDYPHHKTLGSYWLIALSIRFFGSNELALRLPSIIFSFVCLIITYWITKIISNKKSALISLASLSSMPLWIQYSRYTSPDVPFVSCILLVIFFFLKFLNTSKDSSKYFYIFLSGLFISFAFFIRSYMAFVPLIGLSPFLIFHFIRIKNIFRYLFFAGIFIGSIPTILNFYFAFQIHGLEGITALFDFAKKQAIGSFDFLNILIIPLNSFYFTFPIGFLLIFLFAFTRPNNNIRYPLLVYFYPLISLIIILFMSTSYPHYFLFLLPSLSILFAVNIENHSYIYNFSNKTIKHLLLFFMIILSCILVSFVFYYNTTPLNISYRNTLLVYIVCCLMLLSYISSTRFVFNTSDNHFHFIGFFYNIIIPQYISLSLLYNFGFLGNPNYNTKSFINDASVSSIINSNTIFLYNVDSKIQTLLSYYLPSSKVIKSINYISNYNYIITSDINTLQTFKREAQFRKIKQYDNLILLINISK